MAMLPAGISHPGTFKTARWMKHGERDSSRSVEGRKQRAWRVIHAAESSRDLLPLIEGQTAVGMRPFLLTPAGRGFGPVLEECRNGTASRISLLQSWNHVREWRKILQEGMEDIPADVIHAHSFPAGMAAVRNSSGVVYQLRQTIERIASAAGNCEEDSWLARSFRAAEHFVLTRSGAVVATSHALRLECLERGVSPENVFLIPDPVDTELLESTADRNWLERTTVTGPQSVIFLVPGLPHHPAWEFRDSLSRWMRVASIVRQDNVEAVFVFLCDDTSAEAVHELAAACNLASWTRVLNPQFGAKAIASADVVICDREHAGAGFALEAMARGRALLAADVENHRDVTSDGRGCLWFRPAEVSDIAFRARFLAGNPQFRRALGVAGREHCASTRSSEVVATQYDAVYHMAFSKRKNSDASPPKAHLVPLQVGG